MQVQKTRRPWRDLKAPDDLKVPFFPLREPLQALERYDSTSFWFTGMKPATKRSYAGHLRLFCLFYSTTPDILIKLSSNELKTLLDAYLKYLIDIAVKEAGKPKQGRVSVNSVGQYFTGLRSFLVDEHLKEINWKRYEKKFPARISSSLRSYYLEEIKKLYNFADKYDRPIILLEYCAWVRVGAIGAIRFRDLIPIPEYPELKFLKVYADDMNEYYYVVVTPEFLKALDELTDYRQRVWKEKVTPDSYIICPKYSQHVKVRPVNQPLSEVAVRTRLRNLAKNAGVDITNIQPNHGMRKAGNTVAKNAHMDKEFKELLMGHSTGLDEVYYDVEVPQSRKAIVIEYMKAIDDLTINEENRLKRKLETVVKEKDFYKSHLIEQSKKQDEDIAVLKRRLGID